jgi:hypothetical protein
VLPEDWLVDARGFWAALTPLTGLTALEGCVAGLEGAWMYVGDGNADSWPVVSRLRRLCLGHTGDSVDGIEVYLSHQVSGTISGLTALEALWVDHGTQIYPTNLRELRLHSVFRDSFQGFMTYSSITSLTLELHEGDEVYFSDLPPLLKVLTLVQQVWQPFIRLGNLHPLPHLRRLSVHGFELSLAAMCCIVARHPCLEEVHFYRPLLPHIRGWGIELISDVEDVLEHARCALGLLARKPVVMVSEVDDSMDHVGNWVSPVVLKTLKA